VLTPFEALAVAAAGVGAGAVNTIVGSGSLITFPTLVAVGYPTVTANVSNNIGLVPGSVAGVYGYRRELEGQGRRVKILGAASASGGLTGAILLLALPSTVFDAIVPALVLLACGLMAVQPLLSKRLAERRTEDTPDLGPAPVAIAFFAGVYGGYFGAAQGVILLAMLSIFLPQDLQRSNALKNVLAGLVNGVAAVIFIVFADVAWEAVALVAVGAIVGATAGARLGRKIPPNALRIGVIVIGVLVAVRMWMT
jgi:uncharacterized membrane protein YfcA